MTLSHVKPNNKTTHHPCVDLNIQYEPDICYYFLAVLRDSIQQMPPSAQTEARHLLKQTLRTPFNAYVTVTLQVDALCSIAFCKTLNGINALNTFISLLVSILLNLLHCWQTCYWNFWKGTPSCTLTHPERCHQGFLHVSSSLNPS